MKMYKVELYILDFEDSGAQDYVATIAQELNTITKVGEIKTADIGEFNDDHELNFIKTDIETFRKYFK